MYTFQINAVLLNFPFIVETWKNGFPTKYGAAKLFATLIIIRNGFYYIMMISEGSCDSTDAENSSQE